MPGQEHVPARPRDAESAMPDGQEPVPPSGAPVPATSGAPRGTDLRPDRPRTSGIDHPAVPGLIALLAALAFALARWQTWAQGSISRFILVGRHFSHPAQLPHGIPVAPTYGYDGQFFYRLALSPFNFHHTAYGITMDRPYRYMRIGYPMLTWLVSAGQHSLVPVMLVAVNIAAANATAIVFVTLDSSIFTVIPPLEASAGCLETRVRRRRTPGHAICEAYSEDPGPPDSRRSSVSVRTSTTPTMIVT